VIFLGHLLIILKFPIHITHIVSWRTILFGLWVTRKLNFRFTSRTYINTAETRLSDRTQYVTQGYENTYKRQTVMNQNYLLTQTKSMIFNLFITSMLS